MPRKRQASREYAGNGSEPTNTRKALSWWIARYQREIKAGSLLVIVPRRALCMFAAAEAYRRLGVRQNWRCESATEA